MDLYQTIDMAIQNNPLLELDEETLLKNQEQNPENETLMDRTLNQLIESPDLPFFSGGIYDDPPDEKPFKQHDTLEDKMSQQLHVDVSDPLHLKIGEFIIGNLNEDGYLTLSCEEIAATLGVENSETVVQILKIIQGFDPPGIAARDLQECLLIQLAGNASRESELASSIVRECLKELGQKKFSEITKKLKTPIDEVKAATRLIASLEPRPARNYRPIRESIYIKPDVTIVLTEDKKFLVHVNKDGLPPLRINQKYKALIRQGKLSTSEKKFVREQLQNAVIFIKSIEQRGQTIREIAEHILNNQQEFFKNGHFGLTPMTLKDVAHALDRNESTISRAIHNKYIDTPKGLFPFKFFFSQSVGKASTNTSGTGENNVSNRSIKEQIKELIENENKTSPMSDAEIQQYFLKRGTSIARRTITKYRQMERILPSHLRKI
jgi:RNA polymerase sigma-54 factor